MNIQRTAEQIRETKNVIHLIGIITPPRGHDRVRAHLVGFFWRDFWIRICHGENHRVFGHGFDHVLRDRPFCRNTKKNISAAHRVFKAAQVGFHRMGRFPLVHPFRAALVNHTFRVANNTILMLRPHGFQQLKAGDPCRACTVQNDTDIFDFFARQMQRVDQTRRTDHRCSVLVIMKDRNIHFFLETLFNHETFGGLDILKINPAKGGPHQAHGVHEFIDIFRGKLDINRVDIGKAFEQDRFTFHHGL